MANGSRANCLIGRVQ